MDLTEKCAVQGAAAGLTLAAAAALLASCGVVGPVPGGAAPAAGSTSAPSGAASAGESTATSAGGLAQVLAPSQPSEQQLLRGTLPGSVVPGLEHDEPGPAGRLKDGRYTGFEPGNDGAFVEIKGVGDPDVDWRADSVRYVDIVGDTAKEAVVILSRSRGGAQWPNAVIAYDTGGTVVWSWDGMGTDGEPRESTSFAAATGTSVDISVDGTHPDSAGTANLGTSLYRLSKGADGVAWALVKGP